MSCSTVVVYLPAIKLFKRRNLEKSWEVLRSLEKSWEAFKFLGELVRIILDHYDSCSLWPLLRLLYNGLIDQPDTESHWSRQLLTVLAVRSSTGLPHFGILGSFGAVRSTAVIRYAFSLWLHINAQSKGQEWPKMFVLWRGRGDV